MATDLDILRHKEWLGFLQPVGLVVSPPALVKAQAVVDRGQVVELQQRLQESVCTEAILGRIEEGTAWIKDFSSFAEQILGWLPSDLVGAAGQEELPTNLEVVLSDYGETLRPTYTVRDVDTQNWMILIQEVSPGHDLDSDALVGESGGWKATYQEKFERLLRETQIPIGLLTNGTQIRLVYAPRGESSGHLTFPVQAMTEVAGRLILGAMYMLLGADRLFNVPTNCRLPKILSDSRDYQAEVSTKLAGQVLDALWELLRGFQTANAAVNGKLLDELAEADPQHIYGGLITTLMRLVFLLYAEDEGLMPDDEVYQRNYAVSGLYEKLREDAGNYPDTIDQRYGAWAWLLSLFRLVYDGGGATPEYLPARHGQLFDPQEYPFLEGGVRGGDDSDSSNSSAPQVPRIPDGVIYRMLEKLLILDGERLSYRSLDVEQIGSVYEAIMGFEVEVAEGRSIAVRPKDVVVNVVVILAEKPANRAKLLQDLGECKLTGKGLAALKEAKTAEEVVAALDRRVSSRTPNLLPKGSLYLQPGEERRRTGSHYTPRKLTQPIVETTLRPVLEGLGEHPTAEQILNLKVCDLAMGSGAFLVEACRQLADQVVAAWERERQEGMKGWAESENASPTLALSAASVEDSLLLARRLVAQRCLYGVDKNPFAVNLAKLSLWLVTLAKDLPFTFLDHALKCGDSLVGLTRAEIGAFGKDPLAELPLMKLLKEQVDRAKSYRSQIQDTRTDEDAEKNLARLQEADHELEDARLTGDIAIAAFFDGIGKSKKEREELQETYESLVREWRQSSLSAIPDRSSSLQTISKRLRYSVRPIIPFNWEIEFPEVFDRENPGFDTVLGNPPFAGKNTTIISHPEGYLDWLKEVHPESHGNSDIVAHFFRRAFTIIRQKGTLGLIATNTIAQGDTRTTGLRYICNNGGTIYNAQKRFKWIGAAAVVVSVLNIFKGLYQGRKTLNGKEALLISAFLFHKGGNEDPATLLANKNKSFIGSYILGMGFTFDDTNPDATPIAEMHRLIEKDPRNAERIFPYIGGEEVNSSPTHTHARYVINFGEMSEAEAQQYPDLMAILEEKVKPKRLRDNRASYRTYWWQYAEKRVDLVKTIASLDQVLVGAQTSKYKCFTFLPNGYVYDQKLVVFGLRSFSAFASIHSRIHENWVLFFGSSLEDRPVYTPSDCFETFPFPETWETNPTLESIGKEYYEFRADLMVRNNQGLTDTYNRFHDPNETDLDLLKLRQLHEQMDRAVLNAYGWTDIPTTCGFALDYLDIDTDDLPSDVSDRIASGDLWFPTIDEAVAFNGAIGSKRKLPWRYRWSEEVHDEVLARLLDLNQKRHQEEIRGGKQAEAKAKAKGKGKRAKPKNKPSTDAENLSIFDL